MMEDLKMSRLFRIPIGKSPKKDWTKSDRQIESDVAAGKLDFLVKEAVVEKREQKLKDL
jgi:hypothetical protein